MQVRLVHLDSGSTEDDLSGAMRFFIIPRTCPASEQQEGQDGSEHDKLRITKGVEARASGSLF